jgi:hypothetical protein
MSSLLVSWAVVVGVVGACVVCAPLYGWCFAGEGRTVRLRSRERLSVYTGGAHALVLSVFLAVFVSEGFRAAGLRSPGGCLLVDISSILIPLYAYMYIMRGLRVVIGYSPEYRMAYGWLLRPRYVFFAVRRENPPPRARVPPPTPPTARAATRRSCSSGRACWRRRCWA